MLTRICCLILCLICGIVAPAQTMPRPQAATPADEAWEQAQELYRQRAWNQAETAFESFRRQYAHDTRVLAALHYNGVCRFERGDQHGAIRAWRYVMQTAKNDPDDLAIFMQAASCLYDALPDSRFQHERERLLARLLSDHSNHATTILLHAQEGTARFDNADFTGAMRFYTPVAAHLDPVARKNHELATALTTRGAPDYQVILQAAEEYFVNDDLDRAIEFYRLLQRQNLDANMAAEARTKLGWCLYSKGDWQEAEKLWQGVIRQSPPRSEWVARSRWHLIQVMAGPADKYNRAIELCEIQAKEFPGHPEGERALFTRAWLFWTRKDWKRAKPAFEELITAYPHLANAPPILHYLRDCEEGVK